MKSSEKQRRQPHLFDLRASNRTSDYEIVELHVGAAMGTTQTHLLAVTHRSARRWTSRFENGVGGKGWNRLFNMVPRGGIEPPTP